MYQIYIIIKIGRKVIEKTVTVSTLEALTFFCGLKHHPEEPAYIRDEKAGELLKVIPSTVMYMTGTKVSVPDLTEQLDGVAEVIAHKETFKENDVVIEKTFEAQPIKPMRKVELYPRIVTEKSDKPRPAKGTPEFYNITAKFLIVCPGCGAFKYARLYRDSDNIQCGNCGDPIDTTDYLNAKITCGCCGKYYEIYVPQGTKEVSCSFCNSVVDLEPSSKGNF